MREDRKMTTDVMDWAEPTLEILRRHLDSEPRVESAEDLARAVEKAISQVTLDQRAKLWSGLLGKQVLYPHPSGVSFWIRLGDGISMYAVRSDRDDAATRFVLSHLTPGGTFLDVGANTGWFALRAAHRYRELGGGSVHAFEPQPVMADLITRSSGENRLEDHLSLHRIAVGNEARTVWMSTPAFNSGGSLVRFKEGNESFAVEMKTLDSLGLEIDRVDILKVDIEGSEPLFIEGAAEFLRKHRPVIYSELHPKKLQWVANRSREEDLGQLEALGYAAFALTASAELAPFDRADLADPRKLLDVVFKPAERG
jgi:FkbM family methyltransferase